MLVPHLLKIYFGLGLYNISIKFVTKKIFVSLVKQIYVKINSKYKNSTDLSRCSQALLNTILSSCMDSVSSFSNSVRLRVQSRYANQTFTIILNSVFLRVQSIHANQTETLTLNTCSAYSLDILTKPKKLTLNSAYSLDMPTKPTQQH